MKFAISLLITLFLLLANLFEQIGDCLPVGGGEDVSGNQFRSKQQRPSLYSTMFPSRMLPSDYPRPPGAALDAGNDLPKSSSSEYDASNGRQKGPGQRVGVPPVTVEAPVSSESPKSGKLDSDSAAENIDTLPNPDQEQDSDSQLDNPEGLKAETLDAGKDPTVDEKETDIPDETAEQDSDSQLDDPEGLKAETLSAGKDPAVDEKENDITDETKTGGQPSSPGDPIISNSIDSAESLKTSAQADSVASEVIHSPSDPSELKSQVTQAPEGQLKQSPNPPVSPLQDSGDSNPNTEAVKSSVSPAQIDSGADQAVSSVPDPDESNNKMSPIAEIQPDHSPDAPVSPSENSIISNGVSTSEQPRTSMSASSEQPENGKLDKIPDETQPKGLNNVNQPSEKDAEIPDDLKDPNTAQSIPTTTTIKPTENDRASEGDTAGIPSVDDQLSPKSQESDKISTTTLSPGSDKIETNDDDASKDDSVAPSSEVPEINDLGTDPPNEFDSSSEKLSTSSTFSSTNLPLTENNENLATMSRSSVSQSSTSTATSEGDVVSPSTNLPTMLDLLTSDRSSSTSENSLLSGPPKETSLSTTTQPIEDLATTHSTTMVLPKTSPVIDDDETSPDSQPPTFSTQSTELMNEKTSPDVITSRSTTTTTTTTTSTTTTAPTTASSTTTTSTTTASSTTASTTTIKSKAPEEEISETDNGKTSPAQDRKPVATDANGKGRSGGEKLQDDASTASITTPSSGFVDHAKDLVDKVGPFYVALMLLIVVTVAFVFICLCCRLCGRKGKRIRQRRLKEYGQEKEFLLRDRGKSNKYSNDTVTLLDGTSEDEF